MLDLIKRNNAQLQDGDPRQRKERTCEQQSAEELCIVQPGLVLGGGSRRATFLLLPGNRALSSET